MVAVNATDDLGVAPSAQDGRGAGVGIDACEVFGDEWEDAVVIIEIGFAAEEEAALRVLELPTLLPQR